jgi:hypothetical protein
MVAKILSPMRFDVWCAAAVGASVVTARASYRDLYHPGYRLNSLGLRVTRSSPNLI